MDLKTEKKYFVTVINFTFVGTRNGMKVTLETRTPSEFKVGFCFDVKFRFRDPGS